ncbi:MAG: glycoside hydrolase family 3 C-terminal domain-containing protein [Methylococcales bacterium]|nr:glycoside hydrolase family 3 C-terminal domain-containing protein [Methylococcales bacterium]
MNRYLLRAFRLLWLLAGCGFGTPAAGGDTGAAIQARVEKLVGEMSLAEKISLLGGDGFATHAIGRLGIPALEMTDGPVGVRGGQGVTAWPAAIALAASFDPGLTGRMARELGEEARSQRKRLLLGPTVNIARIPWGGRVFEGYGEDPFLTGQLAAAYVKGLQSMGVGASIKHFVANNQEWGRDHIDAQVSERALREIYLPGFAAGVEAGSVSVMAAYNKVNGDYCSENRHLLLDILKTEWGFGGFVVSDWMGTHSTLGAALNGLDLEMPAPVYFGGELLKAVQAGEVPLALIDDKVSRILTALFHLGLFDEAAPAKKFVGYHPRTALEIARESIVLLKNDQALLPLPARKKMSVAVLGPSASRVRSGGGGSSFVNDPAAVSALAGLRQRIRETGADITLDVDDSMTLPGDRTPLPAIVAAPIQGEFFNNTRLEGPPAHSQGYSAIDFDWEWAAPAEAVSANRFSARWNTTLTPRQSGEHAFHLAFTPAARVYLDDVLIYDHWRADADQAPFVDETVRQQLTAGRTYRLRVEFYKLDGLASLQLAIAEPGLQAAGAGAGKPASAAGRADYALLFVGQSVKTESESFDRTSLRLSAAQEELILQTAAANPNTVVVVQAGSPIEMGDWASKVRAIVYAWFPGGQGGLAIADILLGKVNPSGRLPVSFPKTWADSPAAKTYPGVDGVATYSDDIFVGYRYFDRHPQQMAYRFGYGLSYSRFSSHIVKVKVLDDDAAHPLVEVRARVKNTGRRSGAYVAQLYVGALNPPLARPERELKGFKKVFLKPGRAADVTFGLDARAFRHFDEAGMAWTVSPGAYRLSLLSETGQPVADADILLHAKPH